MHYFAGAAGTAPLLERDPTNSRHPIFSPSSTNDRLESLAASVKVVFEVLRCFIRTEVIKMTTRVLTTAFCILILFANDLFGHGIIIVGYSYPSGGGIGDRWAQYAFAADWLRKNGTDGFQQTIVIANPASGPGKIRDPKYVSAMRLVTAKGGRVIMYISSAYGAKGFASIKADIDRAYALYGDCIGGCFIDEFAGHYSGTPTGGAQSYAGLYRDIYWYVSVNYRGLCVVNPGVPFGQNSPNPDAAWWCDIAVIHENSFVNSSNIVVPLWAQTPSHSNKAAIIVHSMPRANQAAVSRLVQQAKAKGVRWIFATDDLQPNPFDTLPGETSGASPNSWSPYWGNEIWSIGQAK